MASCTYIRSHTLQFNMVVPLLFSQNNTKRISYCCLEKFNFISFQRKNDPAVVKCSTKTLSSSECYKTPQRLKVLGKAYYHVHFSSICDRPAIPKACLWKLGEVYSKLKKWTLLYKVFLILLYFFVHTNCEFSALRLCIFLFQNS